MEQEHIKSPDIVLDRKDTDMLYHDFDKFKREATLLKKLLRNANPCSDLKTTQCQDWIAQSVPGIAHFNALYLAHQTQKNRLQKDLQPHYVLTSQDPLLNEWFEFATFPEQRDWTQHRYERLASLLRKASTLIDPDCINAVLEALWLHHVSNPRLKDAVLNKKDAYFSMFTEKEWRNGILLGGKVERLYMRFLAGFLPKLARDGGFLTLSLPQARAFYKLWESYTGERRATLRVFDLDRTGRSLRSPGLHAHACWPEFNFTQGVSDTDVDAKTIRRFQDSLFSGLSLSEQERMWLTRTRTALNIYREASHGLVNPASMPDIPALIDLMLDDRVPIASKHNLSAYLSSLGVSLVDESMRAREFRRTSEEQHAYIMPQTLVWTQTFTEHKAVASRVTLSDWVATPGLSVFILSGSAPAIDQSMLHGMLTILCEYQVKQAITGTMSSMSKGLWIPASPKCSETAATRTHPPAALRHHTLWGWARLAEHAEFTELDDAFFRPKLASEQEGTAVWTRRTLAELSRGFGVFSRLSGGPNLPRMYSPWIDAMVGEIKIG